MKWEKKNSLIPKRQTARPKTYDSVDQYIQNLDPTAGDMIKKIGKLVLSVDKNIS